MEGPSLIILREEARKFVGQRVLSCTSTSNKVDCQGLEGKKLVKLSSWGKHFLMCFESVILRVHFLMFGNYRIGEPKPAKSPRLSLKFTSGAIHLYSCSIQAVSEPIESIYDWRVDVMSDQWDERRVLRLVAKHSESMVCDVLLDQNMFAGSGNIIKNEVLFNLRIHPETKTSALTTAERRALVREVRAYSQRFYEWKKVYALKKNWKIYRKRVCTTCRRAVTLKKTGKLARVSFFCSSCQKVSRRTPRAK